MTAKEIIEHNKSIQEQIESLNRSFIIPKIQKSSGGLTINVTKCSEVMITYPGSAGAYITIRSIDDARWLSRTIMELFPEEEGS